MHPFPNVLLLRDRYSMPTAALVGGPGTITAEATGHLLTSFGNDAFGYVVRPMTAGKYYWEFQVSTLNVLPGIAGSLSNVSYGGYTGTNAGVYAAGGEYPWRQSSWGGGFSSWAAGAIAANDVLGFSYDTTGPFKIYRNNTLGAEITFTSPPATAYAHSGFQGGSGRFRLGPGGCIYAPPAGFDYL